MEKIALKLGGSLITKKDRSFTINTKIIKRVAKEIHEARTEKKFKLLIGHGGGSFPHVPALKFGTHKGIINRNSYRGICEVQDAAARLNRIIVKSLLDVGENAISIQPSSASIASNGRITEFYTKPLESLLNYNMLPVVYGDVAIDTKKGCCILSTEEILNSLSRKFKFGKVISAGIVDGVFTDNPLKNRNAKLISKITPRNFSEIKNMLGDSSGIDVTGGMLHKVEKLVDLAKYGVNSQIINGLVKNNVKKALLDNESIGTIITG